MRDLRRISRQWSVKLQIPVFIWKDKNANANKWKACQTFPVLKRKGDHLIYQMVESRIHYVNQKEWRFHVAPRFYKRAIRSIHPLCSPRSTPTCQFDIKAPTYIRSGCTDLRARGPHRLWASAHIYMLEQRKIYGCNKYPFYKNFPHPLSYLFPCTSYLPFSLICLFIGK